MGCLIAIGCGLGLLGLLIFIMALSSGESFGTALFTGIVGVLVILILPSLMKK